MSQIVASSSAPVPNRRALALAPGLALTGAIAIVAFVASHRVAYLANYQMIIAIICGAVVQNVRGAPAAAHEGVAFSLRRILRFAIVLLGLQITAQQAAEIGGAGVAIIAIALLSTLLATMLLGRVLGLPRGLSLLIGVGTSICGASAIMAAKAAVHGRDDDAAYAIASVTLFGTIAIFAYPLANGLLHLTPHAFGLWAGGSIHEVAQVMATAFDGGPEALRIGAISKLTRVAMMAPVIIAIGEIYMRLGSDDDDGSRAAPPFPWFLIGFLAMVGVASFVAVPHEGAIGAATGALRDNMGSIATATAFLMSMAMAAMGLQTDLRHVFSMGARPLALGLFASLFISGAMLAMTLWIA